MNNNSDFLFSLKCSSLNDKVCYSQNIKHGGKIILCQTLLKFYTSTTVKYPMMFEIMKNDHKVHCGMIEFTAAKGEMYLPQWMMTQLNISNGEKAFIKYFELPHGKSIEFQPHKSEFLNIDNHKSVLEKNLVNFACLSKGDTIPIYHDGNVFYGDIVDCKPSDSISIIDCDLEVDFKAPKDYKESLNTSQHQPVENVHQTNNSINLNGNQEITQRKYGPMLDYKVGCLSFQQDSFKSYVNNESANEKETKFTAFQGKGQRLKD